MKNEWMSLLYESWKLIIDPQARPCHYIYTSCLYVRPSVCPSPKQISSEKSDLYWLDGGSGRVDRWWHTCLVKVISDLSLQWSHFIMSQVSVSSNFKEPVCQEKLFAEYFFHWNFQTFLKAHQLRSQEEKFLPSQLRR